MHDDARINRRQAMFGAVVLGLGRRAHPARMNASSFVREAASRIRERLSPLVSSGQVPALVALIARGDAVEYVVLGSRIQQDSIFRIASLSKPVSAVGAMLLIEEGKLRLDEPVDSFLPELAHRSVLKRLDGALDETVPARRAITVGDLLDFKLGLGLLLEPPHRYPILRQIAHLKLLGFGPPDPDAPVTHDQWMKDLATLPLMAQPGERWLYNTGSCVLGVLIERVSGTSLSDFLKERLFNPLGMHDTDFFVRPEALLRLVDAYRPATPVPQRVEGGATSPYARAPRFEDAAAGLVSTVDDYLSFSRFMLRRGLSGQGGRVLPQALVDSMTQDRLTASQRREGRAILGAGRGWGYGLSVISDGRTRLPSGAFGWNGGLGTSWLADPHTNTTALLFTQLALSSPQSLGPHELFWQAVFA